ncbi:hypothetical protein BJ878DRAFT_477587 [Calycina marina]|uniref:Uncharacterized protein n=1 Tax=Calycina marina TaxID=1763456 RepID=A0A9P7Z7U7_9HELO|nr:hypothetical protein BJ878DRAFT_477587 [Calycina marina]
MTPFACLKGSIPSTPTKKRQEIYNTPARSHLFQQFDDDCAVFSTSEIIRNATPSRATCNRWLEQRNRYGSPAYRNRRRESKILGRKPHHPPEFWKAFVSKPNNNGEREQDLEVQMAGEGAKVGKRQARYQIAKHTKGGWKYAAAYTAKKTSRNSRDDRVSYGNEHKGKPIDGWWNTIYFTDEAHYDPLQQRRPGILREVGTRYDAENIGQAADYRRQATYGCFGQLVRDIGTSII